MNSLPPRTFARRLPESVALLAGVAALVLAGCAGTRGYPAGESSREVDQLLQPPQAVGRVYRVDPEETRIHIRVDPAGPLARLGHIHIVGGPALDGRVIVTPDWRQSFLELSLDVSDLEVDRPDMRRAEGLEADSGPDAEAIESTRENMLGQRVLDRERHPGIRVVGVVASGPQWQPDLTVQVHLRDTVREMTVPVVLEFDDDRLTASGRLRVRQSEFGIEPFATAGGSLQVADEVIVRFRIVAYTEE